ncbi:cysteine proteinase [Vararia minispora EC-137]|uniref:Cysteine proteinase n=1 Tax=Vararia minispora EC-137 TaxID=1314806 RepID=A0ACB8QGN7_9AGAM|nr:cysteine proteinase [Vararia minispora EC-137]
MTSTPLPEEQPPAPRLNATQLPDVDVPQPSGNAPLVVDENTDLSTLTPAQLYELNQRTLDESTRSSSDLPLIAAVAPIRVLREEYDGAPAFVRQIDFLATKGYHGIRRTRGDGDCFYRSLAFAYIERIMSTPDPALEATIAISTLDAAVPLLETVGFDKFAYEDFYEELLGLLRRVGSGAPDQLSPETLLSAFQAPEVSTAIVVFLRLLTSAQIRCDPDAFDAFLFHPDFGNQMTARDFCESFVEPTGKEADHVQMTALARALKVNAKVAYLDGHDPNGAVDFVSFESALDPSTPPVVLLYRPGHYDILDTRSLEAIQL